MVFDSHNRFIQNRPAANPTNGIWNKDVYKYPVVLESFFLKRLSTKLWKKKMEKTKNRAGKKERFEHIYKEYSKPMYLYALSFLVSEEEAEDAIQEVFINFWKDNTYQKIQNEVTKTYLFRSVKNNCLNRLKKKDVLRDRLDLFREDVAEEEMMMWNDTLIQEVGTAIEEMPEQTREIIQGVFFREMKYQEVADYLGISINTVKTLLKNGMRHLRERFAERVDLFLIIVLIKKVGIQRKEKESFIE